MEEKKLTDEEVIKALEHCGSQHHIKGCIDCPMRGIENCYDEPLTDNALNLIHRLKAENADLREKRMDAEFAIDKWMEENEKQNAEIERLKEELAEERVKDADRFVSVLVLKQENTKLQKQVDELKLDLENWKKAAYGYKYAEEQAVKDTAKEILQTIKRAKENGQIYYNEDFMITAQKAYGVEVE